ncbi:MAG TPA: hypothetical protein PKW44_01720 [Methylophilaceae bacterium]|nr:hypothetical protein [Methylophilaceae bacterium]HQR61144.1 hypothetical protein [Methylophilaceae bacterium]
MSESPEDTRHFEQVLSRLNALMKHSRGSLDSPDGMAPATPSAELFAPQAESGSGTEQAAVLQDALPGTIPLLTDIYEGEIDEASPIALPLQDNSAIVNAFVEALMPQLLEVLERMLGEEMEKTRATLLSRIEVETSAVLRQHLSNLD